MHCLLFINIGHRRMHPLLLSNNGCAQDELMFASTGVPTASARIVLCYSGNQPPLFAAAKYRGGPHVLQATLVQTCFPALAQGVPTMYLSLQGR